MGKVKVLFIAGAGRSGSTLLNNILGQYDGVFGGGELRYIWDRAIQMDDRCACGEHFSDCPCWEMIMQSAYGDHVPDPDEMVEIRERIRNRHMLITSIPAATRAFHRRQEKYADSLSRLYPAIRDVTNSQVIVDSSKYPSHGFVLGQIPEIELYVLHLVRDPRAVSYSWQVKKKYGNERNGAVRYMDQVSPYRSALWWVSWNRSTELNWGQERDRYRRWTYEEFVAEPEEHLSKLLDWLDVDAKVTDVVQNRAVEFKPVHCFSGNPSRFNNGPVELRHDERWRDGMKLKDRALVTAVTWNGLRRYGYRLWN